MSLGPIILNAFSLYPANLHVQGRSTVACNESFLSCKCRG